MGSGDRDVALTQTGWGLIFGPHEEIGELRCGSHVDSHGTEVWSSRKQLEELTFGPHIGNLGNRYMALT